MNQIETYKDMLLEVLEHKRQDLEMMLRYQSRANERDKTIKMLQDKISELEAK